jgi:hypothetical protein
MAIAAVYGLTLVATMIIGFGLGTLLGLAWGVTREPTDPFRP